MDHLIYLPNLTFVALPIPEIIGGTQKNLGSPCIRPRSIFSQIFNRFLFAWTIWIYLPSLPFVSLHIPEIIGGTSKIWGVPGFAHPPYSPKILKSFCSHGPCALISRSCRRYRKQPCPSTASAHSLVTLCCSLLQTRVPRTATLATRSVRLPLFRPLFQVPVDNTYLASSHWDTQ